MRRDVLFDALSLGYLLFLSMLMLALWRGYPIFVDIYYHLSVMRGFDYAGGIVLRDFWEFAPAGRPHLYPPLLHILMLALFKVGFSVDVLGKLVSFILFPAQLVSLYVYMRHVFSPKAAFFSILILSTPLGYLWANSVISASALVLFFTPLLFLAVEKKKTMVSSLILALSLYSHLGIGHSSALALILYGVVNPQKRKVCFSTVVAAYILYLPWGIHVLLNVSYLNRSFESSVLDPSTVVHLPMVALALLGIFVAITKRKEGRNLVPLYYLVALIPVVFTSPNRFWLSCGGLPFAMMGGMGLSHLAEKMEIATRRRTSSLIFAGIVFLSLLLFNPVLKTTPHKGLEIRNEPPLLPSFFSGRFWRSGNLWDEDTERLLQFVVRNTSENDILHVSHPPLGCLITAYTGRAQTSGMFHEVSPYRQTMQKDASLIVVEEGRGLKENTVTGKRATQIGRFAVYRNETSTKRIAAEPAVPTEIAFLLVALALALIIADWFRGR